MKRTFLGTILSAGILGASAFAQEAAPESQLDPLDLSRFQVVKPGETLPTVESVADLEKMANDAFAAGDCDDAIPKIIEYYTKVNILANVIRRGVEPYYGASFDDKKLYFSKIINDLAKAETTANNYVKKRNIAWVMEAECLIKLERHDEAITSLFRALDYISVGYDERGLWEKARKLLWDEVHYAPK